MKIITLLILSILPAAAANRYFVGTGNWGDTNRWSLTDGGSGGQTVPGSSDAVFFTANSGNATVDSLTRSAGSLDFTGYTGTITMTFGVSVSGSVTLASAMTIAGSGTLTVTGAGTLTANTKVWPNALTITASATVTLADAWRSNGLLTLGTSTNATVLNGSTLTAAGSLRCGVSAGSVSGTTVVTLVGTGTLDAPSQSTGRCRNPLNINATGNTITVSGLFLVDLSVVSYNGGTVIAGNTWATSSGTAKPYGWVQ